jgi:hypothetical protein
VLIAAGCFSSELVEKCEDLIRSRAHAVIICEVCPANRARRIDQEFRGSRDVSLGTAVLMQQVIVQDGFQPFIREKRVSVALLAAVVARDSRGIHADGNNLHAARFEFVELFLETP